jgi:hypothetical protein
VKETLAARPQRPVALVEEPQLAGEPKTAA